MKNSLFKGTLPLTKLILRRDMIRLPVWLFSLIFTSIIIALAFTNLYTSDMDQLQMAETMKNPAMTAMVGPSYSLENYTYGPIMAHQMLLFTALTVGVMSILLVSRHTRQDEEEGRLEMIRSLPVGKLANLKATLGTLYGANIILALFTGLGLFALNIDTMGFHGSMLYGAILGVTGMFFASSTALFSQLTVTSRGTIAYSFTFLLASYFLRAIGDIGNEFLSLISPLGIILRTQVYVNNYWWPVVIMFIASILIGILAFYLNTIRDLEAGFIKIKSGKTHASKFLLSPMGLNIKLQKTVIIGWAAAMFFLGASYGSVLQDVESFLGSSEMFQDLIAQIGGDSVVEQFTAILMLVMSLIGSIPAIQIIMRFRGEEKRNRTEQIISKSISKTKFMFTYVLLAHLVSIVMVFFAILGLYASASQTMDNPILLSSVLKSGMIYLPAIWILLGISSFLMGTLPKLISLTWAYLIYAFIVGYFGGILQVSDTLKKLSPFGHIPQLPAQQINWVTLIIMVIISLSLTCIGHFAYRRRDLQG